MKLFLKIILALTLTQTLLGCVEKGHLDLAEISVGMKRAEVRSILGEPAEVTKFPEIRHFCDTFQYFTIEGPKYSHVRYDVDIVESIVTNRNYICALTDPDGEIHRL